MTQVENAFKRYLESLTGSERDTAAELMKAYDYIKSFQVTKNVSERSPLASDRNCPDLWNR